MPCDFSYSHYRAILKVVLKSGFVVTNFRDLPRHAKKEKIIILRHDIDALPHRHLALAKIEKSLGVKATYFVRVHGQYYYPSQKKPLSVLKAIMKMSHEIGLHSEARTLSSVFQMDSVALFRSEKRFLEDILGVKIETASEHGDLNHSKDFWRNHFFTQTAKKAVGIRRHTQEYPEYRYLSDSLGRWKDGCLCQNLGQSKLQVLVHAEWWGPNAKKEMIQLNKKYASI